MDSRNVDNEQGLVLVAVASGMGGIQIYNQS